MVMNRLSHEASIRGRPLLRSASSGIVQCLYSRAATKRGAASIRRNTVFTREMRQPTRVTGSLGSQLFNFIAA